jgi:hypothetical protein
LLIDRKVPAASLFSGPYYFVEQLGFRKIIGTTFMMASIITGTPDPEDVRKFFRALRRAQRDIDVRPELFTHYYKKEFPLRLTRWTRADGDRVSVSCSSRIPRRHSRIPLNGSRGMASSAARKWEATCENSIFMPAAG